jgi:hypothetical protein
MFGVSIGIMDGATVSGGGAAFESIATVNGTGSSGSITFSSIAGDWEHLQIRANARGTFNGLAAINVRLNGISTSTYASHNVRGNGSAVSAGRNANVDYMYEGDFLYGGTTYSNAHTVFVMDIHDYTSTTRNKTLRSIGGYDANGSGSIFLSSGLSRTTAAVTSVTIDTDSGVNFTATSTFSLYGIKG